MADLGHVSVALTFFAALYTAIASLIGLRRNAAPLLESARNAAYLGVVAITAALGALLYLLVKRDFSVSYVRSHVSSYLPLGYTISALWAGQEGSLLIWVWLLALFALILIARRRHWSVAFGTYALATVTGVEAFLALVLLLPSNPFAVLPIAPAEGQGLNPLLQNVWMIAHPPVVFASYAAYTVPLALAVAGVLTDELGGDWLRTARRWALLSWLLLGAGILMGAYWAYLELGWGGYWAWDPVENSSLIPWLLGAGLLHGLLMQQRRGMFKQWNLWLIFFTFVLCIFATFVTRSGIIKSVHAFERSSLGTYFAAFMVLCLIGFITLMRQHRTMLASEQPVEEPLSREGGLMLSILLFVGAAALVLIGTLFPALVELLRGRQAALDAAFYERTVGPLAQIIVLVMGICPWLAWGGISGGALWRRLLPGLITALVVVIVLLVVGLCEILALLSFGVAAFVVASLVGLLISDVASRRKSAVSTLSALWSTLRRMRHRYGAHLVHLGTVCIAIGITGSSVYQRDVQTSLTPGEAAEIFGYRIAYQQMLRERKPEYQRVVAVVDAYRGNRPLGTLRPSKDYFFTREQWVTEVAIHTTLRQDLYIILAGFEQDGLASFRILINPLVVWLWIGGIALVLGGAIAWWPSGSRRS